MPLIQVKLTNRLNKKAIPNMALLHWHSSSMSSRHIDVPLTLTTSTFGVWWIMVDGVEFPGASILLLTTFIAEYRNIEISFRLKNAYQIYGGYTQSSPNVHPAICRVEKTSAWLKKRGEFSAKNIAEYRIPIFQRFCARSSIRYQVLCTYKMCI